MYVNSAFLLIDETLPMYFEPVFDKLIFTCVKRLIAFARFSVSKFPIVRIIFVSNIGIFF